MTEKQNWSIFGTVFEAIFTDKTFQLLYKDESEGNATLTLTEIRGPKAGNKLLLPVKIVELRPKLFRTAVLRIRIDGSSVCLPTV